MWGQKLKNSPIHCVPRYSLYHNVLVWFKVHSFSTFSAPEPELNLKYICDAKKHSEISDNISRRKGKGNITQVHSLYQKFLKNNEQTLQKQFLKEALQIPNSCHPSVVSYSEEGKIVKNVGSRQMFDFKPKTFDDLVSKSGLLRHDRLSHVTGYRTYFLQGDLAELEQALIQYTVAKLLKHKFVLVSVPDLLHSSIIKACGMETHGDRVQIYHIDSEEHEDVCLSGTSEMALGGLFTNKIFSEKKLPLRVAAVSRCYRAETSSTEERKGIIYRVHQFNKVEMFGITRNQSERESELLLQEFLDIQENLFTALNIHFKIIDMAPSELGASAYRKFDIEAWLPGHEIYGEISSCSNCTDFQSRRLNIKYNDNNLESFVHTVNGTACAIPRMLLTLVETHQDSAGEIHIPKVLQPYMGDRIVLRKCKPFTKLVKLKFMKCDVIK